VPEFISKPTRGAANPSGFTIQKFSGHAGLVPFCGFLYRQRFHALLAGVLPHVRVSPKAIPKADLALSFIVGLLAAAAKKLTHLAHLRRDVVLVLTCNDKRYLADREHVANCFSHYLW
jgi:hypothetical protein